MNLIIHTIMNAFKRLMLAASALIGADAIEDIPEPERPNPRPAPTPVKIEPIAPKKTRRGRQSIKRINGVWRIVK